VIAHGGGVPVEEALLPFAGGAGAGLILLGRACAFLPERWISGPGRIPIPEAAIRRPKTGKREA
jgi:hypothetical protein